MTGTESSSARCRSPLTIRSRASLAVMSPVSSIVTSGCAAPRGEHRAPQRRRTRPVLRRSRRGARRAGPRETARRAACRRAPSPCAPRRRATARWNAGSLDAQRVAVEVAVLARGRPRAVLVEQLIAACGLADGAVLELLRARRDADGQGEHDEESQAPIARHGRRMLQRPIVATDLTGRFYGRR